MELSIIDYFYNNDETIFDEANSNKDYCKARERALKLYDKLKQTLTDEQKDCLEKFIENETERADIKNRISFKFGVKYGVRITAESMFD